MCRNILAQPKRKLRVHRQFWQKKDGSKQFETKNSDIVKSLALLAVKHHIYVADLYQALGLAKTTEKHNAATYQ